MSQCGGGWVSVVSQHALPRKAGHCLVQELNFLAYVRERGGREVGFAGWHPASAGFCSCATVPYQDEEVPKVQCLI